jgi:hypothetical protein
MLTRGQKRRLSISDDSPAERKKVKKYHSKAVKRKADELDTSLAPGEGKGEKKQKTDALPTTDELLARTQGKGRTLKYLFDQVMGLETDFSRKFCMDVFMFFTPMERMTKLMKFSKRWHDHFAQEKLPWRWASQTADIRIRKYYTPEHVPHPMPDWPFPYKELCRMRVHYWNGNACLTFEYMGRLYDMWVIPDCLKFACDCRDMSRYAGCAKLNS